MMPLSFVDFVCCPGWVGEKGVKSPINTDGQSDLGMTSLKNWSMKIIKH